MSVHSGETAKMTGDVRCEECHSKMHITIGHKVPKCPNCGNETFESSSDDVGMQP